LRSAQVQEFFAEKCVVAVIQWLKAIVMLQRRALPAFKETGCRMTRKGHRVLFENGTEDEKASAGWPQMIASYLWSDPEQFKH
tara:strand:- start:403 stop:651 length:249 start_codon:yes stop_codon:yes gene_type:complete